MKQQKWITLAGIALLVGGICPFGVLADTAASSTSSTTTSETTASTATTTTASSSAAAAASTTSATSTSSSSTAQAASTTSSTTTSTTSSAAATLANTTTSAAALAANTAVADGTYTINYETKKADSEDASTMSKYLSTPAHLKVKNGAYQIAVTFTGPTAYNLQLWTYDSAGAKQKPTVLSQKTDGSNTVSVYEFSVPSLSEAFTANITYTVAGVYTGDHDFRMIFDESSLTADSEYPSASASTEASSSTAVATIDTATTTENVAVAKTKAVSSADFSIVQPDGTSTSMMDTYVNKPLYLVKEDDGYTAYLTVNHASWYKSFKMKVGDEYVDGTKVDDQDNDDETQVYRFSVSDPSQNIPAKVHIIVPFINYDNEYDVVIKIDASSMKDVTDSKPAYIDNTAEETPASSSTESSTSSSSDSSSTTSETTTSTSSTSSDSNSTTDETTSTSSTTDSSTTDETTPTSSISSDSSSKTNDTTTPVFDPLATVKKASYVTGKLTVYENGTKQKSVSMMNQYVNNPFYAKKTKTGYTVYLTVNHASWYQSFQVKSNGKYVNATKVADSDKDAETQVYRFNVKNLTDVIAAQVHVIVPTINYDHTYKVDIKLDTSTVKAITKVPSYVQTATEEGTSSNPQTGDESQSGTKTVSAYVPDAADKPTGLQNAATTVVPVATSKAARATTAVKNPKTGVDTTTVWLYGSAFLVSALGFFVVAKRRVL